MNTTAQWIGAKLRAVRDIAADVREFEIDAGAAFVPAAPGSHIDIGVEIAGRPATRSYSLVDAGEGSVYRIAVKLLAESRGGSAHMWKLQPGAQISITLPISHFELNRQCKSYLLVAGGIGVTPILSMARALQDGNADYRVLYAGRSRKTMAYLDELQRLCDERLSVFASDEGRRIDIAAEIAALDSSGEAYVCGPIRMIEDSRSLWGSSARPAQSLRFETFASSGHFPNAPFIVRLPNIGRMIEVAASQTLLEALEAEGIEAMYDCRKGECGLCALDILACDGKLDHRDVFFSEEEKAEGHKLCACVSRITGGSISLDTGERPR